MVNATASLTIAYHRKGPAGSYLSPERTTPSMIDRWKIANTRIIGVTAPADPAVIMFHCAPTLPEDSGSPTGSVYICRDSATIRGHKYAFQLPIKVRMASAASEGFTRGKA